MSYNWDLFLHLLSTLVLLAIFVPYQYKPKWKWWDWVHIFFWVLLLGISGILLSIRLGLHLAPKLPLWLTLKFAILLLLPILIVFFRKRKANIKFSIWLMSLLFISATFLGVFKLPI